MNAFITYHIESSIIIAVFYLFYRLLLRNETFFRTNRFVLLSAIPTAYIIPLIDIPIQSSAPVAGIPVVTLPAINLAPATVQAETTSSTSPLLYLYVLGAALLAVHAFYGFLSVYRLRRKTQAERNKNQQTYYIHKGDSFSFFRMVFLNTANKSKNELNQIEAHERVHVEEYHSVDALLIHLAIIFQWFNPFVWLMKRAIFENHEFIADRETSRNASEYSYQDLLLRQAAGIPLSSLVHPFNKISLKRRFKMLLRNQSNKINLFKYFLLIPVIGTLFWGISCDNNGDTLFNNGEEDWGEKVVNNLTNDTAGKEVIAFMSDGNEGQTYIMNVKSKEAYTQPEKGPTFKGSESLQEYLNKNIEYPEEAKVNNISGIVYVYFEINKKGAVQNARILKGIRDSFDNEVLDAVKSMPDWEPAYFMGQPLVIQMVMPVSFSKNATKSEAEKFRQKAGLPDDHSGKDEPFVVVEKQPQFKGGEEARIKYLANNIEYPKEARENGIQGTVYINFIVEKDGSISNVKVIRGIGGGCDKEAMEVIENMPKWIPGKNDGKPVRTEFNMPIRFTLDPSKPEKPDEVSDNSDVYVVVDEHPEFIGGKASRMEYLRNHIDYPQDAKENKIQGKVYIQFVVEKDGSVSNVKLLRGLYESCDQEALETIRNMPNWKPGKKDGKPVRTQVNMPVNFTLGK